METLTLEQAYYIGELIAAIMIIISIFYLAAQVRQSNIATRLRTVQEISLGFTSVYQSVCENEDLADIYQRGIYDFNQLDRLEKMRFVVLLNRVLRIIYEMYYQRQTGVVDDKAWNVFLRLFQDGFQTPGFKIYWEMKHHWFDEDFQGFVQNSLIEATDTKQLYPAPDG